jgi:hypothetical protein
MLERESGIELGRATLDGWVMRVGELVQPIIRLMAAELLAQQLHPSRRNAAGSAKRAGPGEESSGLPLAV